VSDLTVPASVNGLSHLSRLTHHSEVFALLSSQELHSRTHPDISQPGICVERSLSALAPLVSPVNEGTVDGHIFVLSLTIIEGDCSALVVVQGEKR
jgi:hypothetical protein